MLCCPTWGFCPSAQRSWQFDKNPVRKYSLRRQARADRQPTYNQAPLAPQRLPRPPAAQAPVAEAELLAPATRAPSARRPDTASGYSTPTPARVSALPVSSFALHPRQVSPPRHCQAAMGDQGSANTNSVGASDATTAKLWPLYSVVDAESPQGSQWVHLTRCGALRWDALQGPADKELCVLGHRIPLRPGEMKRRLERKTRGFQDG